MQKIQTYKKCNKIIQKCQMQENNTIKKYKEIKIQYEYKKIQENTRK